MSERLLEISENIPQEVTYKMLTMISIHMGEN